MRLSISTVATYLTIGPHSPILQRTFDMLTPPSALPALPAPLTSYWPIHMYNLTQIVITVVIFIVTLTKAAPVFPVIIIVFVPIRLWVGRKIFGKQVLQRVDAWACRPGRPDDDDIDEPDDQKSGDIRPKDEEGGEASSRGVKKNVNAAGQGSDNDEYKEKYEEKANGEEMCETADFDNNRKNKLE